MIVISFPTDHITSSTALVFPLKKMIEECRKRGVLVLVDGAHAPGQMEINLEELRPDFYTGNFHKWMYTPRGFSLGPRGSPRLVHALSDVKQIQRGLPDGVLCTGHQGRYSVFPDSGGHSVLQGCRRNGESPCSDIEGGILLF